jgi:hypothetical protein
MMGLAASRFEHDAVAAANSRRRVMSVEQALNWAFGAECATVDFADEAAPDLYRSTVSSAWLVAQHGMIGCRIDGGGRSLPHDDAQMIASAVAALAPEQGGRAMAVQIAQLARAGQRPEWRGDLRRQIVPMGMQHNQHGWTATTEDAARLGDVGWPVQSRTSRRRGVVREAVRYCPVRIIDPSRRVAAMRRSYLDWWGALLHLSMDLRVRGILGSVEITRVMPPMTPWRAKGD